MLDDLNSPDLSGQALVLKAWETRLFGRAFIAREDLDLSTIACELAHVSVLALDEEGLRFRLAGSGWYETDFKKDGDKIDGTMSWGALPAKMATPTHRRPVITDRMPSASTQRTPCMSTRNWRLRSPAASTTPASRISIASPEPTWREDRSTEPTASIVSTPRWEAHTAWRVR